MSNKKYLYGAAVQGIQSFILETNKLREIAGASELIEQICTFIDAEEFFGKVVGEGNSLQGKITKIQGAAGAIKFLFHNKKDCENFVLFYPKWVMERVPSVTISQAVKKCDSFPSVSDYRELEKRIRTQRNKPVVQHGLSLMITERARRTGKAGIDWSKRNNEVLDNSTKQKESLYEKKDNKVKDALFSKFIPEDANEKYGQYMKEAPEDIDKLMKGQEGEWLAIMHADGNNLGKIIQAMMTELETAEEDEPKEQVDKLREGLCERLADFSIRVDKATRKTARIVTSKIILEKFEKNSNSQDQLPFRPVILGGDDITIIIRGDLAFDFTREYLKEFEKQTKEYFKDFGIEKLEKGLTACAGIAYVKPHYPFHYALHLSEKLCGVSKEISKGMVKDEENPKSCLMFHRVHSSFIDDYSNIKERELKAKSSGTRFDFGPYFMDKTAPDSYTTACQLKKWAIISNQKDSPKSGLRNWLSDLQVNSGRAEQRMKRIRTITPNYYDEELGLKNEIIERGEDKYTHIHDAITLASILKGEDYEQ